MKRALIAIALTSVIGLPAFAQDASQIDSVKNGAASCEGCNLFQADFSYTDMKQRNFTSARLAQANLTAGIFNKSKFDRAELKWINAAACLFTGASFVNTKMEDGTYVGSLFHSADFENAIIKGSNFSGAEMETARNLTQAQLNTACGDRETKLPNGLTIPRCTN